ncbi:MAG: hypothetical protein RSC04_06450 [Bacteroidales bacterium]
MKTSKFTTKKSVNNARNYCFSTKTPTHEEQYVWRRAKLESQIAQVWNRNQQKKQGLLSEPEMIYFKLKKNARGIPPDIIYLLANFIKSIKKNH